MAGAGVGAGGVGEGAGGLPEGMSTASTVKLKS